MDSEPYSNQVSFIGDSYQPNPQQSVHGFLASFTLEPLNFEIDPFWEQSQKQHDKNSGHELTGPASNILQSRPNYSVALDVEKNRLPLEKKESNRQKCDQSSKQNKKKANSQRKNNKSWSQVEHQRFCYFYALEIIKKYKENKGCFYSWYKPKNKRNPDRFFNRMANYVGRSRSECRSHDQLKKKESKKRNKDVFEYVQKELQRWKDDDEKSKKLVKILKSLRAYQTEYLQFLKMKSIEVTKIICSQQ